MKAWLRRKEDYLMTVSLRNFVFVLMLFTLVLLFPNRAAAEDACVGECQDTQTYYTFCGPCGNIQPYDECVMPGCICGLCESVGYGECHCWIDNKYYRYESYGIILEEGGCSGSDCGERRSHASRILSQPSLSARLRNARGFVTQDNSEPMLPVERMFVLSRCTHTYVMFIPQVP